ncbi:MAG: hypothetical protein Q9209_006238 [Squamulea sp. 1 TL-2023]
MPPSAVTDSPYLANSPKDLAPVQIERIDEKTVKIATETFKYTFPTEPTIHGRFQARSSSTFDIHYSEIHRLYNLMNERADLGDPTKSKTSCIEGHVGFSAEMKELEIKLRSWVLEMQWIQYLTCINLQEKDGNIGM